jgi:phage baseplate assembly protein W
MASIFNTDLVVVPHMVAHDTSVLDLTLRRHLVRQTRPSAPALEVADLSTVGERENLAQALILRLLTPRGTLAALGHANYGSRLHELIGQNKTPALRNLCRAFILEVVAQEPRVEDKAVDITFDEPAETLSSFVFTLAVTPRSGDAPIGISLEIGL